MNPESKPARQHHERTQPASSESAYEWLSAYGFARHYAKGKTVADLSHQEAGYGSLLLAQSAQSVTALSDLPKLPLPEGRFDVVVAFGVIESLENAQDLVRKAKGVLKEEGVLLVSAPDKRADATNYRAGVDGRRGMYVPELRGLLERHFGHVRLYHQGAVAGGFVFPVSEELTDGGMPVESVRLSSSGPRFGAEPPTTRSVMAVCSDEAEALGREERAYLLLDRDRGVFAESEERAEDVELMRDEIRRMQETEVQAFVEAIKVRQSLVRELLRSPYSYRKLILEEIRYRQSIILGNIHALRQKDAKGLARGALRRLSALYRREGRKP